MSTLKPAIFSFFSGSGFLDLGFENSGYEVVFVNEFHPPFMDAYKHSRAVMNKPIPRFGYAEKSIEEVDHKKLKDAIKALKKEKRTLSASSVAHLARIFPLRVRTRGATERMVSCLKAT